MLSRGRTRITLVSGATKRRWSSAGRKAHPGAGSLHPVAIGAVVEVTKLLKPHDSIPHAELMKSLARRVVNGAMLHLIKMWLEAPVEETDEHGRKHRSTRNRDEGRGTPQGAPISPLLSNLHAPVRGGPNVGSCLIDEGRPSEPAAGASSKPPSAAVVKSHGRERRRKRPGKNRADRPGQRWRGSGFCGATTWRSATHDRVDNSGGGCRVTARQPTGHPALLWFIPDRR
jgi:hypothetical protein